MGEYNVRKLRIGENTYNLPSINDEKASAATLYSSEKIEELLKQLKRRSSEIDSVYFTSSTAPNLTSKADGEAFASCEINYNNETITCFATLKVQGNSSASYPKKNFTVKFYSDMGGTTSKKIDVGWGKQSKYCFKANYIDATHARNIVSANIAADMVKSRPDSAFKTKLLECPNLGLVDGFPIKVYMNGLFWGIYTWNMPKDKWTYNMNPNTDILLCSDLHTAATAFESAWDNDVDWELEVGNMPLADVRTKVNVLIDFVANSTDEQFIANLTGETPIIDLYSVIDYYCYCALAYHPDGITKNMLLMSYDNGDSWGLGLYDMDATFCLHWNGLSFYDIDSRGVEMSGGGNLLLKRVRECFGDELLARYNTLRQSALSTSNIFSKIDEISNKLSDNLLSKEHTKWTGIPQANVNTSDKFKEQVFERSSIVDSRMQLIESDPIIYRLSAPITITRSTTPAEFSPASLVNEGGNISRILDGTKDYTIFVSFSLSSLWKQYNDIVECRLHSRRLSQDIWCFAYADNETVGDFSLYVSNFIISRGLFLNTKYNLLITYDHTTKNRYFYFDDKLVFTQVIDDCGIDKYVAEHDPNVIRPLLLFSGGYDNNNEYLTEGTIYDVYFGENFINSSEKISTIFNRRSESKELKGIKSYSNTILINKEGDSEEANVADHAGRFTTVSKYPFDANDSFTSAELTGDNINFPGTITATTPDSCCIVWNSDDINSSKSPGGYQNLQITTTKNKVLNCPITFCERTIDNPREMVNQDPCLQTDFTLKDDFTIYLDFTFTEHSNTQPYPDLINFRFLKNGTPNHAVSDNLLIPVVFVSKGDGTTYTIGVSGSGIERLPYNDTDKKGYVGNAYDWSFPASSSVGKRIKVVLTKKGMVHKVFCSLDTSGYYMWDNTGKWEVGTDYLSGDSYVANNIGEIYGQGGKIYNWLYSNNVYFYTKAIPDVEAFALLLNSDRITYN